MRWFDVGVAETILKWLAWDADLVTLFKPFVWRYLVISPSTTLGTYPIMVKKKLFDRPGNHSNNNDRPGNHSNNNDLKQRERGGLGNQNDDQKLIVSFF